MLEPVLASVFRPALTFRLTPKLSSGGFAPTPPLAISGTPGPATVGVPYSFTPAVSGGSGTKSFSLSGSLPAGLSFSSSTGAITGTPTTAGTSSGIGITVTDSSGSATLSGLSIAVATAVAADAFALDFAANSYSGPSGAIPDPVSAGLLSVTRPSALTVPNAAGVYSTFAAGTLARNDMGLWRRGKTRTNSIRNNSMTGAAAGTPGTLPAGTSPIGWSSTGLPSGVTASVVGTGAADPDKGLPYIDISFSGTAAAAANYVLQFGGNSQITAAAGDYWMLSAWLALVSGTFPSDGTSAIKLLSTYVGSSNQSLGAGSILVSDDRVMNRDTKPRRVKSVTLAPSGTTPVVGLVKPAIQISFKSGAAYNFTLRVIAPQMEKVASAADDASLPILTTTAAVTATKDTLSVAGALLANLQTGKGAVEMTTSEMRSSGLDFRTEENLLLVNGNVKALKRTADGRIASDLPGVPQTYKSWRSQFGWTQKHALSWTASGAQVASTSPRHASSIQAGTQPSITTVELDYDGCLARLDTQNQALTSVVSYQAISADVVAYGATSGGIVAAAQALASGKSAAVVGGWREVQPGGMATGGLGAVDASVSVLSDAFGGMSLDYAYWCNEYLGRSSLDTKTIDPNDALRFFDYLIRKYKVNQHWSKGVVTATKAGARIASFNTTMGQSVTAKTFIDCSYEGDLMAAAGVGFTVGREAKDANNPFNGNRGSMPYTTLSAGTSDHQFTATTGEGYTGILSIDPYVTPGNAGSALLPGVQAGGAGTIDAGDGAIQAYNFRQTTTINPALAYPMVTNGSPPAVYNAQTYELLGRYLAALTAAGKTAVAIGTTPGANQYNIGLFVILNSIGNFYDLNANNGFSSDAFGMNWGAGWQALMQANGIISPSANYAVGSYAEREIYWKWQESFTRGFWYYLAYSGDSRIPAQIATDAASMALSVNHYLDPHENDDIHWMTQLYVREARRMLGTLTLDHLDITATDGTAPKSLNVIAAGSYSIDSHHVRRYVDPSGRVVNEGNLFINSSGNKVFPIAAEYITPKQSECTNLFVTFAASARHTGFGALRMEMSHMAMSQAAAIMAAQVASQGTQPDVQTWITNNYTSDIRPAVLAAGGVAPLVN